MSSKKSKKSKEVQNQDLERETTNAATSMRAKEGLGAYTEDEDSANHDEDQDAPKGKRKR
jgi:hypothetical protein